jgi:hypothetical protein
MADKKKDEKIVTTEDGEFEAQDDNPGGGTPLASATGGTIRPGGENKGRKTGEFWGAVEKDLLEQSKKLNKGKKNFKANVPKKGNEVGPRE